MIAPSPRKSSESAFSALRPGEDGTCHLDDTHAEIECDDEREGSPVASGLLAKVAWTAFAGVAHAPLLLARSLWSDKPEVCRLASVAAKNRKRCDRVLPVVCRGL